MMILAAAAVAATLWSAHPSDGVEMRLTREGDVNRLDFDFHGHGGYAIARQTLPRDLPANYQFTFRIRAEAPSENLEFKLLHGDDVWWRNRRDFVFPRQWTTVATRKRQIEFAWGPVHEAELAHIDGLEVVVTAGSGGKGTVWFSDPELESLPPTPAEAVSVSSATATFDAKRELGGLVIDWKAKPRGAWRVLVDGVPHAPETDRFVWLPDAEAKEIRVVGGKVKTLTVEPPSWAPAANDFWSIVAKAARRGAYPRYLVGEQAYWTVVGNDHDAAEALVGEDGNVEPFKGGGSIEPILLVGGRKLTWADVNITHSLAEGDLPIPTVTWQARGVTMTVTAAVSKTSMLQLRYRVKGDGYVQLIVRPFQVNPSTQWLNAPGGVGRASAWQTSAFAAAGLKPGLRGRAIDVNIPLQRGAKREPLAAIAARWRNQLHRVAFDIPADPRIGNTIRTSIAYMLIHRDGAALQPGSRSYERSWIRDGALMAAVLLRLGHADAAKDFASWFAKYQYDDGKVPCCVDRRGADPVPENDSHGELIYLVAEIWRLTHDRALVERLWPHVDAAATYIDALRARNHWQFEGLVTESISHEGYSAKPMHSYWDDLFALKGLEDAAELARVVGHETRAAELAASAASMRRDLAASIRRTIDEHHIDYVPGSAELGDFDATSTAIGISPLSLTSVFPERELHNTFARYLASLSRSRDDYTPYEMRNIGALIRLDNRTQAVPLIDIYLQDRRPAAWNGWAEVVRTDPRKPGFIGDMPHAWVASDFVRSLLDAIVFEREDGTIVVGAGIPSSWLAKPMHVGPIPTSRGPVDVRAWRDASGEHYAIRAPGCGKVVVQQVPLECGR